MFIVKAILWFFVLALVFIHPLIAIALILFLLFC